MALLGSESEMKIIIKAKDEASAIIDNFNKKNKESIENLKKIAKVGSAAVLAVGAASVKMAADFETSMSNVATLVDTNTESMEEMGNQVIDISKRVPVALEDLSGALYDVRSAGIDAAGAMEVLENSARLGVAGLGTTKEATDVLTSAINAFGLDAKKSDQWADVFFKTVKSGKTNISELSQGFGQVAPLANELGLQFEDLMATTAAMTASGMKASVAYTQQRAVLSSMLKPTAEMEAAMAKAGITSENLSDTISEKGLTGTIKILSDAVDGNQGEMAKMFGSVEGLNAVMMLLGDTGENATAVFNDMTDGQNALDEAMKKQNETANAQYQILKNNLNAELIKLGNEILPVLIEAIPVVRDLMGQLYNKFVEVTDKLGDMIFWTWQMYDAVVASFDKMKTDVETILNYIMDNIITPIIDAISSKIREIGDAVDYIIQKLEQMIQKASEALSSVNSKVSGVGEYLGGGIQSGLEATGIISREHGGTIPGPVGMPVPIIAHGQETVIPAGQSSGVGGGVSVTINNPVVRNDEDIVKIKQVIDEYFRSLIINRKLQL